MIEVLSSKEPLSTSSDEAEDVFEKGTSLIFMYSVGWNLYFWTVGIALWYTDEEETEAEMEDGEGHVHRNSSCLSSPRARKIKDSLVKLVKNPVNIALVLGLITGLVEPIKDTIIDKVGYN